MFYIYKRGEYLLEQGIGAAPFTPRSP